MIKKIRFNGQCPVLDELMPKDPTNYGLKILIFNEKFLDNFLLDIIEKTHIYCRKKLHSDFMENRFEINFCKLLLTFIYFFLAPSLIEQLENDIKVYSNDRIESTLNQV